MQRSDEAAAFSWDLTFDMSGRPKGAKQALGRPLDGGVRCHRGVYALSAETQVATSILDDEEPPFRAMT